MVTERGLSLRSVLPGIMFALNRCERSSGQDWFNDRGSLP
jgi:hypothetical protein